MNNNIQYEKNLHHQVQKKQRINLSQIQPTFSNSLPLNHNKNNNKIINKKDKQIINPSFLQPFNTKKQNQEKDFQLNYMKIQNNNYQKILLEEQNSLQLAQRKNGGIKINMNKFPADFFAKMQNNKKQHKKNDSQINNYNNNHRNYKNKITSNKLYNKNNKKQYEFQSDGDYNYKFHHKAESQRNHISPEKTSFFGFFDDKNINQNSQNSQVYQKNDPKQKYYNKSKSLSKHKSNIDNDYQYNHNNSNKLESHNSLSSNPKNNIHNNNIHNNEYQLNMKLRANLQNGQFSQRTKKKATLNVNLNTNKFFNQQKLQQKIYKRNYQTRQESKRQPMIQGQALQNIHRHYTPLVVVNPQKEKQKNDLLDLFPATYDQNINDLIIKSNRGKAIKIISNPQSYTINQQLNLSSEEDNNKNILIRQKNEIINEKIDKKNTKKVNHSSVSSNDKFNKIDLQKKRRSIRDSSSKNQKNQEKPLLSYRQLQIQTTSKIIEIDPNNMTFFVNTSNTSPNKNNKNKKQDKIGGSYFPPVSSKNMIHSQR